MAILAQNHMFLEFEKKLLHQISIKLHYKKAQKLVYMIVILPEKNRFGSKYLTKFYFMSPKIFHLGYQMEWCWFTVPQEQYIFSIYFVCLSTYLIITHWAHFKYSATYVMQCSERYPMHCRLDLGEETWLHSFIENILTHYTYMMDKLGGKKRKAKEEDNCNPCARCAISKCTSCSWELNAKNRPFFSIKDHVEIFWPSSEESDDGYMPGASDNQPAPTAAKADSSSDDDISYILNPSKKKLVTKTKQLQVLYSCKHCNDKFERKNSLKSHMRHWHVHMIANYSAKCSCKRCPTM